MNNDLQFVNDDTRMKPIYDMSWSEIAGLPVAMIHGGEGHSHAHHPLAGWRMKANVYLDGTVRPFSGEFGSVFFTPAPFHPGGRRASLEQPGCAPLPLDLDHLPKVERRLHCGRFHAILRLAEGVLEQESIIADPADRHLLLAWRWTPAFPGVPAPWLWLPVDISPSTSHGSVIGGNLPHYGRVAYAASGSRLATYGPCFRANLEQPLLVRVAYDPSGADPLLPKVDDLECSRTACDAFWADRVARLPAGTPATPRRDLAWSLMLSAGTAIADGTRGRFCLTNGALYAFDHLSPVNQQPGGMYSFRDGNQVAFGLAATFPELARDQLLRTLEASEAQRGIPQMSTAWPGAPYWRHAPGSEGGEVDADTRFASEQVWWWLIALSEYVAVTGDRAILDTTVTDASGRHGDVRRHLDMLLTFALERVGFGAHGITRFLSGDWSDYLGRIGARGRGESFMNAGLMIIACERTAALLGGAAGERLRRLADEQRQACAPFCTGAWYPRAFDDDGVLVGGDDDRLYLDSQPWLALARVGDAEMRRRSLFACVERILTPIGPKLIDRPLQLAEIPTRSHVLYPPGSGENGCVWWLTGYWLAMALAAEGLVAEAEAVVASCSRDRHHACFPREWWSPLMAPDGIDGPDSPHYGKAQQPANAYPQSWAQGFPREMNPNEVAKYPYQIWYAGNVGMGLLPG